MNDKTKTPEETQEMIDGMNEISLYFLIEEIGGFIWRMNHDMAHGRIPIDSHVVIDSDISNVRKHQAYAVERLRDVVEGLDPTDADAHPTTEYFNWYRWWNNWHKNELTEEQWSEISIKMRNGEDISTYRPQGSWQ